MDRINKAVHYHKADFVKHKYQQKQEVPPGSHSCGHFQKAIMSFLLCILRGSEFGLLNLGEGYIDICVFAISSCLRHERIYQLLATFQVFF